MDERVRQNLLYDFYGDLLNDYQKSVYSAAVFDDMSYSELGNEFGITRQAAYDLIKRIEHKLEKYEDRLGLVSRFLEARSKAEELESMIADLEAHIDNSSIDNKDKKTILTKLDVIHKDTVSIIDTL